MIQSKNLYVIVVTLNARQHIEPLLQALKCSVNLRVIVIDNGSIDGTRAFVREQAAKNEGIIAVLNEANIGVANAWNQGLRIAIANGATGYLICGHDTVPMKGTIERLVNNLNAGVPFITGTAVPYDTPECEVPIALGDMPLIAAPDFSFFAFTFRAIEAVAQWDAPNSLQGKLGRPIGPWEWGFFDSALYPCLAPGTRVLRDDLSWVPIGDLHGGDGLVGVDEQIPGPRTSRSYRAAVATALRFLKAPAMRIYFEDGRTITCTHNHRWLAKSPRGGLPWAWRQAARLRIGQRICAPLVPWEPATSFDAGWLSGLFDGEGCLRVQERMRGIGLSQKAGPVLDRALRLLTSMGVVYRRYNRKDGLANIEINRKDDMLRVLGHLRPTRLLQRRAWENQRLRSEFTKGLTITRIDEIGECEVVDLTTSTGTFIAEGLVSHNSYFEDNDYHQRLHRAGMLAARDPQALFRHDCSLTLRSTPGLAQLNAESFRRNAELFRQRWGGLPHELDAPPGARPLNIDEDSWRTMTGGREVQEVPRAEVVAQAQAVYARYQVPQQPTPEQASPPPPPVAAPPLPAAIPVAAPSPNRPARRRAAKQQKRALTSVPPTQGWTPPVEE